MPEYTDYDTPVVDHEHVSGQPVPETKHYVCADCFRHTRPENAQCNCPESRQDYEQHEREKLAQEPGMARIREESLRPSNLRPGTALAIPSPSAAASVSASSGTTIDNLEHIVEQLQKRIEEVRREGGNFETLQEFLGHVQQQIAEESERNLNTRTQEHAAVRLWKTLCNALPTQWQSRMQ